MIAKFVSISDGKNKHQCCFWFFCMTMPLNRGWVKIPKKNMEIISIFIVIDMLLCIMAAALSICLVMKIAGQWWPVVFVIEMVVIATTIEIIHTIIEPAYLGNMIVGGFVILINCIIALYKSIRYKFIKN